MRRSCLLLAIYRLQRERHNFNAVAERVSECCGTQMSISLSTDVCHERPFRWVELNSYPSNLPRQDLPQRCLLISAYVHRTFYVICVSFWDFQNDVGKGYRFYGVWRCITRWTAAGISRLCVSFILKGQSLGTNWQQSNCFPFSFKDFHSDVDKCLVLMTLSHWIFVFWRFEIAY